MKRMLKALSLFLALILLAGCGRSAESAEQSNDVETYSFSIDRETVDSIRLIQDRETQKVWTTDDSEQIDTICDLFAGLSYGPRRYDAGYAGTYLRIEFMAGDALIRQIALANPEEVQFLDEEPGFCVSILSGAWTEADWESFLAMITASAASDIADTIEHPDYVSKFDFAYDKAQKQYVPSLTYPQDGYAEQWTSEQLYDYVGKVLIDKLDRYFDGTKERYAGERPVYFYEDGTVSMYSSFSYVSPGSEGEYGFELTIWVNHDRMDESVERKYSIGDPNNEIQGVPVWLGWSRNYHGAFDDPDTKTDITLLAAFSLDGTYYFLEQQPVSESGDGEGLFLGALQTILTMENQ